MVLCTNDGGVGRVIAMGQEVWINNIVSIINAIILVINLLDFGAIFGVMVVFVTRTEAAEDAGG